MLALCFLCLNKASFWGAFTLAIAYCFYASFIIQLPDIYLYFCTASLNFIVGDILRKDYRVAALCAYSLVFVNVIGFLLWVKFYSPALYDNISAIILIIQLSSLLPKGLLNGFGNNNKRTTAKPPFFNGI